ncbi:MAG: hypothetical protein GY803_15455 [Chloroflexi bacterium]|nr:hypothetical protein [Chloroflexota bacterium]
MSPSYTPIMTPEAESFLDTTVPNMARIFDYLLGGTANFEADREAVENLLQHIPSLRKWARLRRAFIQEAALNLYHEGFGQFLDLGSGMPTENHLHIAVPDACVIYSDINPVAVSYGQSLFAEYVNIEYIYGDVRQLDQIIHAPDVRRLIDLREKVAIGLNTLILFMAEDEMRQLAQELHTWAPPESQIFVVFQTRLDQPASRRYQKMLDLSAVADFPMQLYTLHQNIAMMKPWRPRRIQPLAQFLGLPDDFITESDQIGMGVIFYAAFLEKEAE